MKLSKILPLCAGALILISATTGVSLIARAFTIKEYKAAPAVSLNIPSRPDSLDSENPFKAESLLELRHDNPYAAAGWTTLVPEADGKMRLAGPAGKPSLHSFSTKLRARQFAKGKLAIRTDGRASVKVNGKSLISKTSADSVSTSADAPLTLNPETDYDIMIDIVSLPEEPATEFSLEFVPDKEFEDVEIRGGSSLRKRVSQATAIQGERVASNSLSADGKYMIVKTTEVVSNDETLKNASIREVPSGNTLAADIDFKAQWVAGKNAYVSARKRGDKFDLYLTQVPSFKTERIAYGFPTDEFSLTSDGRYILYYKEVEGQKETGSMKRVKSPDDRIPGDRDRVYIMRYDLKEKVSVPVTYGGPSTTIYSISHDGRKLLYGAMRQTPSQYPFYSTTLIETDIATLKSDTLIRDFRQTLTGASYSPDATRLFITAGPDAFGGIGANYAPHEIGNDFDGQGYIFDIKTRTAKAVTRDFDPSVGYSVWNHADGNIYFVAETGFFNYLYRLEPESGKITLIPTETPYVKSFSVASDNKEWLAYTGGSWTSDGETYLLNRKTGKSVMVAAPLRDYTADYTFGEMEPWNFTATDGSMIEGWMCLPPDFDPSKKYPLIVYYYGGTSPTSVGFYHNYSPQVFASRNYVVYLVNPSGTTGYGQEFSARHVNAWGKMTAEEIIEGTKKFCESHSFVDARKVGCIGASYGGFMTQYLLTRTDIFAAAVSHAGISNVTSYWGEGFWGYSYNSVAAARSYPWTNPELFTKQGSLFNADKIHTPLLLLHGSEDTNVPIGESIQLFNALRILGRDVEFITVDKENHVIRGFDNRLAWQNTIMAWFAKYLQDDPSWWNNLYGK